MIYVTKTGVEVLFKRPHLPLKKGLSFILTNRKTYSTDDFLRCVHKHAGFLCIRVEFDHTYEYPDGRLAHHYKLYFQWGPKLAEPREINALVAQIEDDMQENYGADFRGRTHHRTPNRRGAGSI